VAITMAVAIASAIVIVKRLFPMNCRIADFSVATCCSLYMGA